MSGSGPVGGPSQPDRRGVGRGRNRRGTNPRTQHPPAAEDRTTNRSCRGVRRGRPDRPDRGRVPARREPQHADARRRPPALQEAGGRRPRLRRARCTSRCATSSEIAPLFLKHPHRSTQDGGPAGLGRPTSSSTSSTTSGTARCPSPAGSASCSTCCSRLHGTRLAWERPLWEAHVIEGLRDGRVAMYTKTHHALVDGVSAMRLLAERAVAPTPTSATCPPRGRPPAPRQRRGRPRGRRALADRRPDRRRCARRSGSPPRPPACPARWSGPSTRACSNETSALSLYAPRTILNQNITGSRRFAAQDWPIERLRRDRQGDRHHHQRRGARDVQRRDARPTCSSSTRCPTRSLVSMVPVGLNAKQSQLASAEGGNAVGAVMVQLGTDLADPADRLEAIHRLDAGRQGGAVEHDADADPGDERARPGAGHPRPAPPDAGHRAAAVQPDHQQRARARAPPTTGTARSCSAPTRCRSRSTGWRSTSPARPTTATCASASPAAAAPSRTSSGC